MTDQEGEVRLLEMIFPEQANHYGTLFGGTALSLMAKADFIAATRRSRRHVVLAASDRVAFVVPVRVGELAEITARVDRVGRTAMTVVVELKTTALDVRRTKSKVADCPAGSAPTAQSYSAGVPGLIAQRSPFRPGTKKEKPDGMTTRRRTAFAAAGPLLVTLMVYLMSAFACAGFGETLCVTARSASPGAGTLR